MTKTITISDDVYERLARETGDRSVSEVIAELLESRQTLAQVSGTGVLDANTSDAVKADITAVSQATTERLDDEPS